MGEEVRTRGYFSLLRWRSDPTRDEARNVAVILMAPALGLARLKAAPLSSISSRLRDQGLLDGILVGLESRLTELKPDADSLRKLHESLGNALYVTEPQSVAIFNADTTANALFKAYCGPRRGGGKAATKGVLLDRVVARLRRFGLDVKRGEYVGDFIFDAIVNGSETPKAIEVLSFAAPRKDWVPVQHDAGYFLYALEQLDITGTAFVNPPDARDEAGLRAYNRVTSWFKDVKVRVARPEDLDVEQTALDLLAR
jgi:hypothetical protein